MIVVLGAGLAGLSTALHLEGREYRVIEREPEPGGLARTASVDGFLFDFAGHVLHFKNPIVLELLEQLLGGTLLQIERSAWVRFRDRLIPYPFQAHTHQLPEDVRLECLRSFADTLIRPTPPGPPDPKELLRPFTDWVQGAFGEGFARHFFLPYTQKCFAADPATLTSEWAAGAVPRPGLEDVLRGALGIPNQQFGYHSSFRYPKGGAIRRLPRALAERIQPLSTGVEVVKIESRRRRAHLSNGESIGYEALVATNPLPELIRLIDDLDPEPARMARRLRWSSAASFSYGLEGPLGHSRHWTYYPEPRYPFYRVGFPSNLTPAMAPSGMSSICAEVAYPSDRFPPAEDQHDLVLEQLRQAGEIDRLDRVRVRKRLDLPFARVLFDEHRREVVPVLMDALESLAIHPAGCFGSWSYLSMEGSILEGRRVAEALRG